MKKLSIDNPFFEFMGNLGDWIILNFLFVITSLPVITAGMALTAMYKVALGRRRGESNYIVREYLKACKKEWKQSSILWIICFAAGGLLGFDILYAGYLGKAFSVVIGCLIVVWAFVFSYVFPLQARFQNTIRNTMKNALFLAVRHLPYTILIVALNSIPIICIVMGVYPAMMVIPFYCFVGFALTAKINCIFFDMIFRDFI